MIVTLCINKKQGRDCWECECYHSCLTRARVLNDNNAQARIIGKKRILEIQRIEKGKDGKDNNKT